LVVCAGKDLNPHIFISRYVDGVEDQLRTILLRAITGSDRSRCSRYRAYAIVVGVAYALAPSAQSNGSVAGSRESGVIDPPHNGRIWLLRDGREVPAVAGFSALEGDGRLGLQAVAAAGGNSLQAKKGKYKVNLSHLCSKLEFLMK